MVARTVICVPKSRNRRKPATRSQPQRRPTASPPGGSDGSGRGRYDAGRGGSVSEKIGGLLLSDGPSPDLMVELLPALLWLDHAQGHPRNLCVSGCVTLHHAYAALGIQALPRAVDLMVSNERTGARTLYGRPYPYWSGTTFHGHCVLWLPGSLRFIDPTVEQYPEVRRYRLGPICGRMIAAVSTAEQRAAFARGHLAAGTSIGVRREELMLLYTAVDAEFDDVVMSGRVVIDAGEDAERGGRNLASQALLLLSRPEVVDRARQAPHPRVRALLDFLADAEGFVDDAGDWRFTLPDGATPRLDEIILPTATVPAPPRADITVEPTVPGALAVIDTSAANPRPQRRRLLDILRRRRPNPDSAGS